MTTSEPATGTAAVARPTGLPAALPPALLADPLVRRLEDTAQRRTMAHPGGLLTWRSWGQGQPTLLLHGSHGGWLHWVRNIEPLAAGRHVVAPDLPGFGQSDPPADIERPADHAALLARALPLMDASGAPWDVVGFSLGALVAGFIALAAPERVRRLVLVDAGGLGTPMRFADFRGMKGLDEAGRRAVNRHNLGAMMLHHAESIDDLAIDIAAHFGPLSRTRMQYHVVPDRLLALVRRLRTPIDLIWGEHDFAHPDPAANAAVVRQFQPEAQLRVVADAGHWPMYERPDGFNAALRGLLALPPRAPLPA